MTGLKDIIEGIESVMTTLGFKKVKEVFTFEAVPDSIIDRAFRIETRIDSAEYHLSKIREVDETISVWIAYKALRDIRVVRNNAMTDREAIERALINDSAIAALDCSPIIDMIGGEAEEYAGIYLVSRIDFNFNYEQSIA